MPEPGRKKGQIWRYSFDQPADNWAATDFIDSAWKKGPAGFGAKKSDSKSRTEWNSSDIWLRKTFQYSGKSAGPFFLTVFHSETAKVYLNEKLLTKLDGSNYSYQLVPLPGLDGQLLHQGNNIIAVHCKSGEGKQFIDVGLVEEVHVSQ
jgi:hypothetical protein